MHNASHDNDEDLEQLYYVLVILMFEEQRLRELRRMGLSVGGLGDDDDDDDDDEDDEEEYMEYDHEECDDEEF